MKHSAASTTPRYHVPLFLAAVGHNTVSTPNTKGELSVDLSVARNTLRSSNRHWFQVFSGRCHAFPPFSPLELIWLCFILFALRMPPPRFRLLLVQWTYCIWSIRTLISLLVFLSEVVRGASYDAYLVPGTLFCFIFSRLILTLQSYWSLSTGFFAIIQCEIINK